MTSDIQLLDEFSRTRSEAAFEALVRRHVGLVHSTALRLAGDIHLSKDVTQTVFVILARDTERVRSKLVSGTPFSAWLHTTTRNVAAKAVRAEIRRRAREHKAHMTHSQESGEVGSESEAAWNLVAPHLDRGLSKLSDTDRNALLLRYFERKTAREVGLHLGIGEDAAQKRIRRAVDRLRRLLLRNVPDLTASSLAALLGVWSVQQVPTTFAATLAGAALQGALVAAPTGIKAWITHAAADFAMTKSQGSIAVAILTAVAVPLAVQHQELKQARAETFARSTSAPDLVGFAAGSSTPGAESRQDASEAAELARLRARLAELRALTAEKHKARASLPPAPPPAAHGPVLLQPGRPVPMTDLVDAGNASPEAAAQSVLTHTRDGNLDGALGAFLLSPSDRAEAFDLMTQPGGREMLTQQLQSEVTNLLSVELIGTQPIDERRREVLLRRTSTSGSSTQTLTFGFVGSGWKQLP